MNTNTSTSNAKEFAIKSRNTKRHEMEWFLESVEYFIFLTRVCFGITNTSIFYFQTLLLSRTIYTWTRRIIVISHFDVLHTIMAYLDFGIKALLIEQHFLFEANVQNIYCSELLRYKTNCTEIPSLLMNVLVEAFTNA